MKHKDKDILIGKLVDKSEALRKRVEFLESQNYEDELETLTEIIENLSESLVNLSDALEDSNISYGELLKDVVSLYKRLDKKNEDIEILNLLIGGKG